MRIMFITASISFGGASKMLCFIAESFVNRGYDVCVANLKNTPNRSDYERQLDKRIVIKVVSAKNRIGELSGLLRIARNYKPDVIIAFLGFPNFYATVIGKILHIPSIISERGDPRRTEGRNKIKRAIVYYITNKASGAVFQTEGAKSYYKKSLQNRSIIIANPIFVNEKIDDIPQSKRNKTVVTVGRLDNNQKRYDIMLKAFGLFLQSFPDYRLRIYGCGIDEDRIREWVDNDSIVRGKVDFLGLTTSPMKDISHDSIFLITSDYEGISNALLEAMAVGLPCVSTDHSPGGARLLIQDHINGLLAPVGDYKKIAHALIEFASDSMLAEACGTEAKKVTERFKPDRIIDSWENYIKSIARN